MADEIKRMQELAGIKRQGAAIKGSINNITAAAREAIEKGIIKSGQDQIVNELQSAINTLTPSPDNPVDEKKLKCKNCGGGSGKGLCVLGGCFMLHGVPPKKLTWTCPI